MRKFKSYFTDFKKFQLGMQTKKIILNFQNH